MTQAQPPIGNFLDSEKPPSPSAGKSLGSLVTVTEVPPTTTTQQGVMWGSPGLLGAGHGSLPQFPLWARHQRPVTSPALTGPGPHQVYAVRCRPSATVSWAFSIPNPRHVTSHFPLLPGSSAWGRRTTQPASQAMLVGAAAEGVWAMLNGTPRAKMDSGGVARPWWRRYTPTAQFQTQGLGPDLQGPRLTSPSCSNRLVVSSSSPPERPSFPQPLSLGYNSLQLGNSHRPTSHLSFSVSPSLSFLSLSLFFSFFF